MLSSPESNSSLNTSLRASRRRTFAPHELNTSKSIPFESIYYSPDLEKERHKYLTDNPLRFSGDEATMHPWFRLAKADKMKLAEVEEQVQLLSRDT